MRLLSQHNDEVHDWLYVRGKAKWLGHDLQNEILGMVADKVRQSVVSSVKDAKYFAVIADETTDVSRKEQVSVCVRYVTEKFEIYEAFLGFFETANTDALTLCGIIENGVIACGLDLKNCVGQSYDGAANMRGCISGVQQRMKIIYPKMLYVYCIGHQLNLIVQDALQANCHAKTALSMLTSVVNYIKSSPRRLASFKEFSLGNETHHTNRSLRPLCPTRWVLRLPSIETFVAEYEIILDWLDDVVKDPSKSAITKGAARPLLLGLEDFQVYFMLMLIKEILRLIHPIHVQVQSSAMTVDRCRRLIEGLLVALSGHNNIHEATSFYNACIESSRQIELQLPSVPRASGRRSRDTMRMPSCPVEYFTQIYIELFQKTSEAILARYPSGDLSFLSDIEAVLLGEGDSGNIEKVETFYHDVISPASLKEEIQILKRYISAKSSSISTTSQMAEFLLQNEAISLLTPNLTQLLRVYFTLPCSSCEAERSFSALRRIKTYLRSTMSEQRLNDVCTLNVHQGNIVDTQDLVDAFIKKATVRSNTFATSHTMPSNYRKTAFK
ncbi:zinc finger MYM-type protein 1-like [Ciona intestinalis]